MPREPLIRCSPSYGSMEIRWLRPGRVLLGTTGLLESICSLCGQKQLTTGGVPLLCETCLEKLRRV